MAGWTQHSGHALILDIDNIDTDQLIPARFMSVPRSDGYGEYLLHDMRRDKTGALRSDFPLNQSPSATVLVSGRNFGTGSSREAAVYALVDAGICTVIAPSFADIFAGNAVNNGLLPACLSTDDIVLLCQALQSADGRIEISLASNELKCGLHTFSFELDDTWRTKLRNGWDDIDLTVKYSDEIESYRSARKSTAPWAWAR